MTETNDGLSWESFFSDVSELRELQEQQKQQGFNDFTALGSVLSPNDEVRLHTRFLYSLLNPHGKHYQGTRFLELFLDCIGLTGWLNINSTVVRKEYCPNGQSEQIDLYLTDGEKEIVIENKLNAKDQNRQVIRYLDAIGAKPQKADSTLFIYLTKNRGKPSKLGLGSMPDETTSNQDERFLTVSDDCRHLLDEKDKPTARYMNLWYQTCQRSKDRSIRTWLDRCAQAVNSSENSANIVSAINDYQSVVERATREYVSNVTTLKEFLDREDSIENGYHKQAIKIAKELPSIHRSWLHAAMSDHLEKLMKTFEKNGVATEITHECAKKLVPFLTEAYAKHPEQLIYSAKNNFFGDRRDRTKKGKFYLLERSRPEQPPVVITLFYGSKRLHVGCLFHKDATEQERVIVGSLQWDEMSSDKLRKAIFPGAMTQSKLMKYDGINDLANFESSPQRELLDKLLYTLTAQNGTHA